MGKNSKYIVLLGDGMSDFPIEALGNKTPLEVANTPNMDYISKKGILGLVKTVPDGMNPGSDTANLSVFGYNPEESYSGRAPLEAINMGIDLGEKDAAFRCNIVSIKNNLMESFTSHHIDSKLSEIIINEFSKNIKIPNIEFYPGVSYRNILIWRNYPYKSITNATPPHDIQDLNSLEYLPTGDGSDVLIEIMDRSKEIIENSSLIKNAKKEFNGKPVSAWLWGGGTKPKMDTLKNRFGLYGYTISAVDLIHGIGKAAGLSPIHVDGATGYIDTNYTGKADALLNGLKNANYIYLHVESPDESGHEGNIENKIKSIEDFDKKIVGKVLDGISEYEDYNILIMPDHPTPISTKTHSSDPVPFCMYRKSGWNDSSFENKNSSSYSEISASETGLYIDKGHRLIELMINGKL